MPQVDRLALAVQSRALALPQSGAVVVLRAVPSPFLELIPARPAPLRAELPAAPRRARRGRPCRRPARAGSGGNGGREPHPQPRREPRQHRPRPRPARRPGRPWSSPAPRARGSTASPGRWRGRFRSRAPSSRRTAGCSGSTRPDPLPRRRRRLGARRGARAQRRRLPDRAGHVLARADRSRQPPARRRARRPARRPGRRPRRRLGLARAGRAGERARRSPSSTSTRPRHLALDAARANVADPRARFHWADVTTLGRARRALRRGRSRTRPSTRAAPPSPTSAPPSSPRPRAS